MLRTAVLFGVITVAFASEKLDTLVNAAAGFSAAIQQQLAAVHGDPSPVAFAETTMTYAKAKTDYFNALRNAAPELMAIATGKEPRPPKLDRFAEAFSVAGEQQENLADEETLVW